MADTTAPPPVAKDTPTVPPKSTTPDAPAVPPKDSSAPSCGPSDTGTTSKEDTYALPSASALSTASSLPLLDANGTPHTFSSLYSDSSDSTSRNLIIFIRHFFCTICQQYISHLRSTLPPETLAALPHPTRITIIGCGDPSMITDYLSKTGCPYPLYTDPTNAIYKTLNLGRTLDLGPTEPEYMEGKGVLGTAWKGFVQVLKMPGKAFKAGDWSQIGGEFLFAKGEDGGWENTWVHRMRSTRDHAEVREIKEVLGIVDP